MRELDQVFGVIDEPEAAGNLDAEIQTLIDERNQARSQRNFQRSDEIRDQLLERGIKLVDTPNGTEWHRTDEG